MAYIADSIFDNGLSYAQTNGTRMDITSQEATTYADATSTYSLGNASVSVGAPQNGDVDGRKVVVSSVSSGSVTADGDASHWALTDDVGELLATGSLTQGQPVTNGNTFTLDATDIAIRDA